MAKWRQNIAAVSASAHHGGGAKRPLTPSRFVWRSAYSPKWRRSCARKYHLRPWRAGACRGGGLARENKGNVGAHLRVRLIVPENMRITHGIIHMRRGK